MARIQIELDNDALKALDAEAARRGDSRESFVAGAVATALSTLAAKPTKSAAQKKAEDPKD